MSTRTRPAKKALEAIGAKQVTFGHLLKTLRLSEELSQVTMANKLKISVSHLCDLENGRKFVSLERAKDFAKRLNENEKYFVLVAIRDLLNRAGCDYQVELKAI